MRAFTATLLLLCCLPYATAQRHSSMLSLSPAGGDWHAPTTWSNGQVPDQDKNPTTIGVSVKSALTISTGTVTMGACYIYPRSTNVTVRIGPLAHLNMGSYLSARTSSGGGAQLLVEGSLMLHRGAYIYGDVKFNVQGGYVYSMGRRISLRSRYNTAPTLTVTDGGIVYMRQILAGDGTQVRIDAGELRVDGIEFEGETTIEIRSGSFAASRLANTHMGTFILHEGGELLLAGKLDATSLYKEYPGLAINNGTENLSPEQLSYTYDPGPKRYRSHTRITRR